LHNIKEKFKADIKYYSLQLDSKVKEEEKILRAIKDAQCQF